MEVYRIVQSRARTTDLYGMGAFKAGGRWNSKGTYMLYTSGNSSLAYLESLVHFDRFSIPPHLFIIQMEIDANAPSYLVPGKSYPKDWKTVGLIANQTLGDAWMKERQFLSIQIRSAINPSEFNYLLNPLFPRFYDLVKITNVQEFDMDRRLFIPSK